MNARTPEQTADMLRRSGVFSGQPAAGSPLAIALQRGDWELAALHLLITITTAINALPQDTIDDVFALIDGDEGDA